MPSYFEYDPPKAQPDPQAVQARAVLLDLFKRGVPGYPTDDRYLQSQKFTGIVYTAIRPLLRAVRKADVVALRRKPRRGRVTFGPGGTFAKALTAGYGKGQRDDYVPLDPGHVVSRVIDRPQGRDGVETIGDVLEYGTLQACLTGVAPVWGVPSAPWLDRGEFRPCQLYALPTALTLPQPGASPQYPFGWYRLTPYYASPTQGMGWLNGRAMGAAGAPLDAREVKRRLNKHPLYRWDGYSPLTACAFLLDVAESIDRSRWAAMQHGTNLDALLMVTGADEPTLTKISEGWKQKHGGAENHRKVAMVSTPVSESKFDYKPLNIGAREMDYPNSWEQATAAVLAVFGTPKSVAGLAAATSYSELYAAKQQFHELTVQPECEVWGEFLTTTLAEPWCDEPGEIVVEVTPPPVNDKEMAEQQLARQLQYDLLSYNEARAADNLPPVKGGELPVSVFLDTVRQKVAPPPPPMAGGRPGKADPARADRPTAGAVPTPDNDAAEGSRPPTVTKSEPAAMNTLSDPAGGALVAPATVGKVIRGKRAKRVLRAILKGG